MIIGRFGEEGRPFIEGRLTIRSLKVYADISFIVDTGADRTLLMPADAARMSLDYSRLTRECQSLGVGGASRDYAETAFVTFKDGKKRLLTYKIELVIARRPKAALPVPSMLGRDIINRWNLQYEPGAGTLIAHPQSWDGEAAI